MLAQVRRLLGSCAPVVLAHSGAAPEAADPERIAAQQVGFSGSYVPVQPPFSSANCYCLPWLPLLSPTQLQLPTRCMMPQVRLMALGMRTMALPIGRGALTLGEDLSALT